MKYAVIIEWAGGNYSAYVPDLPGCISVGDTLDDVRANIREAMELHLGSMLRDHDPVPEPSVCEFVEVNVAALQPR